MAQTPYRDIIKTATVDFRFYNGTIRNYANNTNALAFSSPPTFAKANGVDALVYSGESASQTWMTDITGTTEVTIEFLAFLDMKHLGDAGTAAATTNLISGDWNIGFANKPGTGQAFFTQLWSSFNGVSYSTAGYVVLQNLNGTESSTSKFRGSPIHVILSAKFISATSLEITTYVNGVFSNVTSVTFINDFMDPTPINTLFGGYASYVACPVYFLRMWNSYMEDELIFADMFAHAKNILPNVEFSVPSTSQLAFYSPA